MFNVVARPNAWQKDVKETTSAATGGNAKGTTNPVNVPRQDFFAEVLEEVVAHRPSIRLPKRGRASWIAFASGPFGFWDISFGKENRCQIEAYLDMGNQAWNKDLFDDLAAEAVRWTSETNLSLEWHRMDGRRASRIAAQSDPVVLSDVNERLRVHRWAVQTILTMYDALNETLRDRARQIREAGALPA